MKQKIGLFSGIIVSLILIGVNSGFSQEAAVSPEPVPTEAAPESQVESQTQWLWGEVVSVDTQKNELLVKYLDYETDQEKETGVSADDKTTYENIGSLLEIKPQDTVSIDYTVSPEGKNIAKNISVEKPESAEPAAGGVTLPETLPEDLQSPAGTGD